ncbi:hypothetical protein [Natronolimnobius baerhuensis]|nr:hypothetical protein [Natronolimnobius baerhuensis]
MSDRTFQEDLLIVESLVEYNANWYDANPHREGRAYQLADEIAG